MKGLLKKLCDFTFKSLTDESDTKSEEKSEDQTVIISPIPNQT